MQQTAFIALSDYDDYVQTDTEARRIAETILKDKSTL
jgi:hypothetical protein